MRQKSRSPKSWKRPEDDKKSVIFVHSSLDEYGLDAYEFRVMAHVARREGRNQKNAGKGCFATQKTIAATCQMSHRKAQDVLRVLCEAGLLDKEMREGTTNVYRVAPPSKWKEPDVLPSIRKKSKQEQADQRSEVDQSAVDDDWEETDIPA